jgi:hypothetical protein
MLKNIDTRTNDTESIKKKSRLKSRCELKGLNATTKYSKRGFFPVKKVAFLMYFMSNNIN